MHRTDEKKPTGGGHPTAGSTDRAIVPSAPGAGKKLPIRTTGTHLLLALNNALAHAALRLWCATPSRWGRGTIGAKAKAPVCRNTFGKAVATPTDKRGFVIPEFWALVRLHWCRMVYGHGGGHPQGRPHGFTRVTNHHAHPLRVVAQRVVLKSRKGATTMRPSPQASRRAAPVTPTPTTGNHDPIQLFADAHNALAMASYYLRQPEGNHAGAARKAGQALAALRRLAALQEGGAA